MASLDSTLIKEFQCPLCSEYFQPQIVKCSNDHSYCKTCLKKEKSCPECGSIKLTRNKVMECLLDIVILPCRYTERGCQMEGMYGEMKDHQFACQYKKKYYK